MSILIEKSGIFTSVQDLGRNGFRRFGINPNGAMDKRAVGLINVLLGNNESEAVLEMHFPAPQIKFEKAAIIALGGADFGAQINNQAIESWRPHFIDRDQTLDFTRKVSGNRAYLSIKSGFKIKKWLSSASTNLAAKIGGFEGRALQKNDRLFFNSEPETQHTKFLYKLSKNLIPHYSSLTTVRVVAGAEFELLTALSEQDFTSRNFTISNDSNRMGFRLHGAPLYLIEKKELVSSAVDFGTVQLLPDGQIIVLMADHQTSGGYPRIAHVASVDLPILAQLGANDRVNFQLISIAKAEQLALEFAFELNLLKTGVDFRYEFKR